MTVFADRPAPALTFLDAHPKLVYDLPLLPLLG